MLQIFQQPEVKIELERFWLENMFSAFLAVGAHGRIWKLCIYKAVKDQGLEHQGRSSESTDLHFRTSFKILDWKCNN